MSKFGKLPEELAEKILIRFPAKALCQCKILSKKWQSIISDERVVNQHIQHMKHHPSTHVIFSDDHSYSTFEISPHMRYQEQESRFWPLPPTHGIVGSCNGLVLGVDEDHESFFLINPATKVIWRHPIKLYPGICIEHASLFTMYGFGCSESGDFKAVSICYWVNHDGSTGNQNMVVAVYNLTKNTKHLVDPPYDMEYTFLSNGVLVNGKLHWIIRTKPQFKSRIVAFNLANEIFTEIDFPASVDNMTQNLKLVALGCKLGMYGATLGNDLFIMQEYGDGDSWTKATIHGVNINDLEPLCSFDDSNGEFLFGNNFQLSFYNDTKEEISIGAVQMNESLSAFTVKATFVETLLSPESILKEEVNPT